MNFENDYSFKNIEPDQKEIEIKKGKEEELKNEVKEAEEELKESTAPQQQQTDSQGLGFFATLGVSFLSITNRTIGGAEIEVDNIKIMDAKTLDALVISEMIASGKELDAKYLGNSKSSPELRFGLSGLMFFALKGRFIKLREYLASRRKKDAENGKD